MTLVRQIIADTVAEWDESAPLAWTMTDKVTIKGRKEPYVVSFDLRDLTDGYETSFLLELKNLLIERRNQIKLISVAYERYDLRAVLLAVQSEGAFTHKVAEIDRLFLLALGTLAEKLRYNCLATLSRFHRLAPHSPLFAQNLLASDFPTKTSKKGYMGDLIARILAKVLPRAAQVQILRAAEDAWEDGRINIGHFSFLHLIMHVYLRPYSYQHLTLEDLILDTDPETKETTYFLRALLPKTRNASPPTVTISLDRRVGELLVLQRTAVTESYGHLIDRAHLMRLALFPARGLYTDGSWRSTTARAHCGRCTPTALRNGYLDPLIKLPGACKFDFNALRHTIGTQLANAGFPSNMVQAVLRHASPITCQAYVDIVMHGMIDELSEAMAPAFEEHFPVYDRFRSKNDPIAPEKAILSRDERGKRVELTAECGRKIACEYAPIACYPCPRFIPCYDADHSINLDIVEAEIAKYKRAGKPYEPLLNQNKEARLYIMLTVAACNRHRDALSAGDTA
jgi:hypothetical protein